MENEIFSTELESNGAISADLSAQIAWEMDRQAKRAQWEKKNDRQERPDQYRKPNGSGVALPMKPVKAAKSSKRS